MRSLFSVLLFLGCLASFGQGKKHHIILEAAPGQGEYLVIASFEELGDVVTEGEYRIVLTAKNDSIYLGKVRTHDWPQPNFYFLGNDRVAYEWGDEANRTINVLDLATNKLLFSKPGYIASRKPGSDVFLDRKNSILLFHGNERLASSDTGYLMRLDLNTLKTKKLLTYKNSFTIELPLIEVNTQKRIVTAKYSSESGDQISDTAVY